MSDWLTLALIAGALALGLFPVLLLLLRGRTEPDPDEAREPLLGGLNEPLAAQIPMSASGSDDVRRLLLGAGYYHPSALTDYRAVRTALTLAPVLLTAAAVLASPREVAPRIVFLGVLATMLGFSLPRVWLTLRRRARAREISRGLPLAIDLLNLCLTAGLTVLDSFRRVAREMKPTHPALSQELSITARQAELHSLDVAARQWAERSGVPEVSNLALLLVQSERLGADSAATLGELADNFRVTARQRAEAHANRTSFWMLFPSVFCFLVAAAIILVGPAYLEFFEYRQRVGPDLLNPTRDAINRANQQMRPPPDPSNPVPVSPTPP
jgi:tight adherence protein C